MCSGRLFQSLGVQTEKAWSPYMYDLKLDWGINESVNLGLIVFGSKRSYSFNSIIWYEFFCVELFLTNLIIFFLKGNEIFGSLSAEEYNAVIKLVEQAIIATDLALYFQ